MAKIISPFVGSAKGKLGGAVYYSRRGGTFARQRVATVANPQTQAQMVTRIILSTASKAYSLLQPIADHAFQGKVGAASNHQRFMALNVAALRAVVNERENPLTAYSFNLKGMQEALFNEYIVSEGSLPSPVVHVDSFDAEPYAEAKVPFMDAKQKVSEQDTSLTYQNILDYYGLQAGAQLTLLMSTSKFGTAQIGKMQYCRIILSPANGDLGTAFIDANGAINSPNEANEGTSHFHFAVVSSRNTANTLALQWRANTTTWGEPAPGGYAAIFSVLENGVWKRSTSIMIGTPSDIDDFTLGDALESYEKGASSSFYLNGSNLNVTDNG